MTYYAVIDTNVIVSSMLKRSSIPGKVLDYVLQGTVIPLLNHEILSEYADVLTRNEFGFSASDVDVLISFLQEKGIFFDRTKSNELFLDPDDAVFLRSGSNSEKTDGCLFGYRQYQTFPDQIFCRYSA